ncbi:MAG TPA: EAL domain-containing protein [Steroidobacteraceae bacterium]
MFKLDRDAVARFRGGLNKAFTLGNLGIAPRLALAFASVAILAATSNLLVENGVAIVESVTRPGVFSPALSQEIGAQGPAFEKADARVKASRLVLALGKFDKAVLEHVEAGTPDSTARFARARTEVRRFANAFEERHVQITGAPPRAFLAGLKTHEKSAAALIQTAQDRRVALTSYSTTFSRMKERLDGSMDRAWKIMGRVVARQSLLKLTAELDEIQTRFATRNASGTAGDGQARLMNAEQAFAATLQQNEAALRRSQGAEWLAALRSDVTQLQGARAALAQVEQRQAFLTQTFSRETEPLVEVLVRISDKELKRAEVLPPPAPATQAPESAMPAAAPVPAPKSMMQTRIRPVVAWVTVIVLGLLAYICVMTTLSVVRPVRRLLRATTKIAAGRDVAPVPDGGIRELDTLSQAFNAMAKQLAAARAANREAQQSLEGRVEERTRQLQELAERDPLTGLANRRQLFAALNASIARTASTTKLIGAFFLDIDNFKTLNDSMGHAFGDRVLTAIAHRLESAAKSFGFAARLGGDEFMLVHEGAESIDEIESSGNKIVDAFHHPIQIDGRELIVSVSVGASVYPLHAQDAEALLRAADAALFDAKAAGRSRLTIFTPELLVRASVKFRTEQRLRRAIEKGEFELFYQPEVSVKNLEVSLVEALIRWRMPDGSYQCPADFLAVAEESGLILEINDWVMRTAIETASQWHIGPWPEARVAINVSPRQFLDFRFVEKLQRLLEEFQLPPRCLELELTESVLQTGPATIATLERLRAMGVAIALDDFGTGYSSIASLEQLPLTRIKLDRSLIARMDSNPRSASIARATIGLCSELGLEVTAEGVERLEQFTALLGYESMSLQGFLIARPVPRDQLLASVKGAAAHCQDLMLMSRKAEPGANEAVFTDAESRAVPAMGPTRLHPPRRP